MQETVSYCTNCDDFAILVYICETDLITIIIERGFTS